MFPVWSLLRDQFSEFLQRTLSPSEAPEKSSVAASFPPKAKKEEASHNGQIQSYRVSCVFKNQPFLPFFQTHTQNS